MCQQQEDEDNNNSSINSNDPLLEPLPADRTSFKGLTVQPHDVICDRDIAAKQHPGNVEYRTIIRRHRAAYQIAEKRIDKQLVRDKVIDLIHKTKGRFLVKDCGIWVEQDMDKVRDKVSHGLRSSTNNHGEEGSTTSATQQTRKRKAPPAPSMEQLEAEERLLESLVATQESIYATYLQKQPQQQMGETANHASAESNIGSSNNNNNETAQSQAQEQQPPSPQRNRKVRAPRA